MKYLLNNSVLILLITILGVCGYACNDNEQQEEKYRVMTLKVAPYKDYFIGAGKLTDILGYAVTDSTGREYVIDYIQDFTDEYEIGYEYVIKVKAVDQYQGGEFIEDLVGYYYYLIEVISKEKKEIENEADQAIKRDDDAKFKQIARYTVWDFRDFCGTCVGLFREVQQPIS